MAAERNELKRMVMSFHIPELQILLGLMKQNKYGRKAELLQRALQAMSRGISKQVQDEIRDLYRRKFSSRQYLSPELEQIVKPPLGIQQPVLQQSMYYQPESVFSSMMSLPPAHINSLDRIMPVHPDVRLKPLPFYDTIAEILKPSTLMSRSMAGLQECLFSFHLTPRQSQETSVSRDVQVQLRFGLVETSCEQEDKFPSGINVRVNGKPAALPPPIPTNKLGVEPKRPGRPVNITPQCHLSAAAPNHIIVNWNPEIGRSFCVSVYLVTQLNSDILLQRLRQNGIRHPYHTRALVKEKLAVDLDSEIATTSLRISLICPLGKVRMRVPCRASTCSHLQCFDAPTFVQMNEKKPTWICPICDKPAEFGKLIIDGLFTEILSKETSCTEIQFMEDGNWQPSRPDSDECWVSDSPPAPNAKRPKLDKEEISIVNGEISKSASEEPQGLLDVTETIDLTETDDEDEPSSTQPPWPTYLGMPARNTDHSTLLSRVDYSCEQSPQTCNSRSYNSSPPSIINVDTPPPPPAHSPYAPSRSVAHAGSGDGVLNRPPPAHSNCTSTRTSYDLPWVIHRPEVSSISRENAPLSLTLRRLVVDGPALSITSSSSTSTSPFDAS